MNDMFLYLHAVKCISLIFSQMFKGTGKYNVHITIELCVKRSVHLKRILWRLMGWVSPWILKGRFTLLWCINGHFLVQWLFCVKASHSFELGYRCTWNKKKKWDCAIFFFSSKYSHVCIMLHYSTGAFRLLYVCGGLPFKKNGMATQCTFTHLLALVSARQLCEWALKGPSNQIFLP